MKFEYILLIVQLAVVIFLSLFIGMRISEEYVADDVCQHLGYAEGEVEFKKVDSKGYYYITCEGTREKLDKFVVGGS